MILFFHFICLLAQYIAKNISKSISKSKIFSDDDTETGSIISLSSDFLKNTRGDSKQPEYEDGTLKFFPPVYVQRYETVAIILQDPEWKGKFRKVVDFGCAELGFFMYLKNMDGVNEILEVDIDAETLETFAYKAAPLTADYLKRSKPLDVFILAGSIENYDDYLIGTDVVIGIELIEHLSKTAFSKMPYNVFHNIKPKLAIFTTPNADFNSLFPNFPGMRHTDHKFEWTRKQFFNWTQTILKQYPEYSVRFYGVGAGPVGTENLGCCSQMAVFQRCDESEAFTSAREDLGEIHNYKLIKHYKYPVYVDKRTREEKIVHEIQYQVPNLNALPTYYNYENNESEIPMSLLKSYVTDLCTDEEELRTILLNSGMKLKRKNGSWFLVYAESDYNLSDESIGGDSLDGEILPNIRTEVDDDEEKWDWNEDFHLQDITNLRSPRSLEKFELSSTPKNCHDFYDTPRERTSTPGTRDETKSAPQIFNQQQFYTQMSLRSNCRIKSKPFTREKSRLPRRRNEKETGEYFSVSCRQNRRKMSKSCSLDSCLENINCKPPESLISDLIPSGSLSFQKSNPLSSRKRVINDSGSSLFSSSLERGGDSGYPFSYSPPSADSTPEQVDELFTETLSRSTSVSSEEEVVAVVNRRLHQDLFVGEAVVENGDLANNNRDGEGNNVEGLPGQRLANEMRDPNDNMMFFPGVEEFPPWLLNLGELAHRPVYIPLAEHEDEGVVDDSSSDFNQSLDPEDIDCNSESLELS